MTKAFSDVSIKNKEQTYEAIIEMNKNNDYTTGNLLDYEYSLQTNCNRFKQTNWTRKPWFKITN